MDIHALFIEQPHHLRDNVALCLTVICRVQMYMYLRSSIHLSNFSFRYQLESFVMIHLGRPKMQIFWQAIASKTDDVLNDWLDWC